MPEDVRASGARDQGASARAHRWDVTPAEAIAIQQRLREAVIRRDDLGPVRRVAGVDVGFEDGGRITRAAVAVLDPDDLTTLDWALARRPTSFPYIPGLLSFREVPAALEALAQLQDPPDLLLCDGQGIAHPRRMGVACHLGLLADLPAIGVAKSRLTGRHGPVPEARGNWTPLRDKGETVGAVLRSRAGVKPIYVSTGHRVALTTAVTWVLRLLTRYRLPETTRAADALASGRRPPCPGRRPT